MKYIRDYNKKYLPKKDPLKSKSRKITCDMFNKGQINFPLECNECGGFLRLEIHHKIYPQTRDEIKQAVLDGEIILLCKFCHSNVDKSS